MLTLLAVLTATQMPGDAAAAAASFADLPGVTVRTYSVGGEGARNVRAALRNARPATDQHRRVEALTTWRYDTRWFTGASGACEPATATVSHTVTVTLPSLSPDARLDASDRVRWNTYVARLIEYERGRVGVAIAGGRTIQAAMRATTDCAAMQAARADAVRTVSATTAAYDETHARDRAGTAF